MRKRVLSLLLALAMIVTGGLSIASVVEATNETSTVQSVPMLDKIGWTATADSYQNATPGASDGPPGDVLDGNESTFWHSAYNDSGAVKTNPIKGMPKHLIIKFDRATEISAWAYTARDNQNGRFGNYELYAYNGADSDYLAFDAAEWGDPVLTGSFENNGGITYANFKEKVTATQVLVKVISAYGDQKNSYASAAEIDFLAEPIADKELGMSVTVSGTSDGNKGNLFDNDPRTYWTSEEVSDVKTGNAWLQVDLGAVYAINQIDYTPRWDDAVQNRWKCTGNIEKLIVQVSTDGKSFKTISEVDLENDIRNKTEIEAFPHKVTFAAVNARYVRIRGEASYHYQSANRNKFIAIGDLKIYKTIDEAVTPDESEKTEVNLALEKQVTGKWTADGADVAGNSQRPLSMITNNTIDTNDYGEFGSDDRAESAYIQVDLGKVNQITKLHMYRYWQDDRTYEATVVALSEDKDFSDPTIVYNSDVNDVHGLGKGNDATYVETSSGKAIEINETLYARYVRVYMHGQVIADKNTNHIVELQVFGYEAPKVSYDELSDKVEELLNADYTNYTEESVAELNKVLEKAAALIRNGGSEEEIDAMFYAIEDAVEALVLKDADYSKVEAALAKVPSDLSIYTDETVKALNEAITAVKEDLDITKQAEVDAMAEEIEKAIAALQEKTVSQPPSDNNDKEEDKKPSSESSPSDNSTSDKKPSSGSSSLDKKPTSEKSSSDSKPIEILPAPTTSEQNPVTQQVTPTPSAQEPVEESHSAVPAEIIASSETVEISIENLKKIVETGNALIVKFEGLKVTFEIETIKAIIEQAEGSKVLIRVVPVEQHELNEEQQNELEKYDVVICISVQIFSDGEYIGDFKGGKARIEIPFTPETGTKVEHYSVYYVADNGDMTLVPSTYAKGYIIVETDHFSDYVIVYEGETEAAEEEDAVAEETLAEEVQEESGFSVIPIIIVVVLVVAIAVFAIIRKKNGK